MSRISLFILLFFVAGVHTYAEDVYTFTGVSVTRSISETEAVNKESGQSTLRESALQEVMETGYRKFLQRITPQAVWPRHTWLMAELPIKQAIESVSITREDTFPKYVLEATLKFNRDAVRKVLTQQGIAFHETQPAAVLVVPVYEVGQLRVLWEDNNPWRNALKTTLLHQGGLRLTLPAGDIQEVSSLTANMAVLGAQDVLSQIGEKYQVDAVVVSRLTLQQHAGGASYRITNTWYPLGDGAKADLSLRNQGEGGLLLTAELEQVAAQTYGALENHWRAGQTVATGQQGTVFVRMAATTPKTSFKLQHTLQNLPTVKRAVPRLLKKGHVRFQVDFFGKETQLTQALKQAGYTLERVAGGWRVVDSTAVIQRAIEIDADNTFAPHLEGELKTQQDIKTKTDEFAGPPTHTPHQPASSLAELIQRQASESP